MNDKKCPNDAGFKEAVQIKFMTAAATRIVWKI